MKVKDLIILLFPPQDNPNDEVMKSGRALFARHLRKNLLGKKYKKEPNSDIPAMLDELKDRPVVGDSAQQAWLIQVHHKRSDFFAGAFEEGKQFTALAGSTKFDPKTLSQNSTGVYVVAHCSESLMNVFGHHVGAQDERDYNDRIADAAANLVDFFDKLGLKSMTKLCLVACKAVPDNRVQKDTLYCLVMGLHYKGLNPMIAGWDIPIMVNVDEKSPNYGRKQRTDVKDRPFLSQATDHKFVYKYERREGSFDLKEAKANWDGINSAYNRVLKTKDFNKSGIVGDTTPMLRLLYKEKGGLTVNWQVDFARRVKYSPANWSAG